jgi:hypothetical protein
MRAEEFDRRDVLALPGTALRAEEEVMNQQEQEAVIDEKATVTCPRCGGTENLPEYPCFACGAWCLKTIAEHLEAMRQADGEQNGAA